MLSLWPFLLPVAAMSGWFVAKRPLAKKNEVKPRLPKGYVKGLNYILNEQSDKAIDIFISILDVDEETVETHLALGGLFRRRGEVDRSIRIHQNLIARPQLGYSQRIEALKALGKDYMCAGVLDRAERIFNEATLLSKDVDSGSLNCLLSIYLQQKAWHKALDILERLQYATGMPLSSQVAHCYCQIAEEHIITRAFKPALQAIKQAYAADRDSVRVSLLFGEIEYLQENYRQAIKAFKKVRIQDPDYLIETVKPLSRCYAQLGQQQQFLQYLYQLVEEFPRTSIIFCIAKQIKEDEGNEKAIDFASELLNQNPTLRGLHKLIEWHLERAYGKVQTKLLMLYGITEKLLFDKPKYRCHSCGFAGKILHWHCPSCKKWGTTKPICGIEGD